MPDYSDGELEKNDNPGNGHRNADDDDRSGLGSDDEDVFVQAAAIAGDMHHDQQQGRVQVVDESGAVGVSLPNVLRFVVER